MTKKKRARRRRRGVSTATGQQWQEVRRQAPDQGEAQVATAETRPPTEIVLASNPETNDAISSIGIPNELSAGASFTVPSNKREVTYRNLGADFGRGHPEGNKKRSKLPFRSQFDDAEEASIPSQFDDAEEEVEYGFETSAEAFEFITRNAPDSRVLHKTSSGEITITRTGKMAVFNSAEASVQTGEMALAWVDIAWSRAMGWCSYLKEPSITAFEHAIITLMGRGTGSLLLSQLWELFKQTPTKRRLSPPPETLPAYLLERHKRRPLLVRIEHRFDDDDGYTYRLSFY